MCFSSAQVGCQLLVSPVICDAVFYLHVAVWVTKIGSKICAVKISNCFLLFFTWPTIKLCHQYL